jgi:hypothetical protein
MTNMGQGGQGGQNGNPMAGIGQGQLFQANPGWMSAGIGGLAGLGGLAGGMLGGGGLFGTPEHAEQFQQYTPQQQAMMSQMLQQGGQNADFGAIRNQEVNRFNQQTVPSLAARFTGMGGQGGQHSSGFQQALGMSGANLGTDLAGMQSQYGMQQLQMGMRPQFENVMRPRQAGGLEQGLSSVAQLLPLLAFL